MTSNFAGKSSVAGQITETRHPARLRARASCQTRRSKGTGKFSTTMTQDRDWRGSMSDLRLDARAVQAKTATIFPTPRERGGAEALAFPPEPPADANVAKSERPHGPYR